MCYHDDVAQAAAKVGAQAADDVARQAVAKVAAQATDDIAQAAANAGSQAADDIAQAGAKAGAKASKVAGGVIIGVSAVFLVWDIFDLHFTIRDLIEKRARVRQSSREQKQTNLKKYALVVKLNSFIKTRENCRTLILTRTIVDVN